MPTIQQLENCKNWIRNLRNGKYKQGRGAMRPSTGGYCCLAVAAEVCGIEWSVECAGYVRRDDLFDLTDDYGDRNIFFNDELTNVEVIEMFGVSRNTASAVITEGIRMNDDEYKSFDEIADYMERAFDGDTSR